MRTPRLVVAFLTVTALITSGCGAGQTAARSADDIARGWMANTDDMLRGGPVIVGKVPSWHGPLRGQIDDQLKVAPALSAELSPTVRTALERRIQQARDLQDFYTYVDDLPARVSAADDAVPAMVDRSMLFELPPQLRQVIEQAGREIGKSTVCGLAWDLMTPDEKTAAQRSGNGFDPAFARIVELGTDALQGAISGFLRTRALKAFIDPEFVDWALYAQGIHGKAIEITADGRETLVVGDVTVSRAMVQYARICLAPPG
jgi:hypothetical protein